MKDFAIMIGCAIGLYICGFYHGGYVTKNNTLKETLVVTKTVYEDEESCCTRYTCKCKSFKQLSQEQKEKAEKRIKEGSQR